MHIIDLHCDTLLRCYLENTRLAENNGHIDLRRLELGKTTVQCFAIYLPMEGLMRRGRLLEPYTLFQEVYQLYRKEMEENAQRIAPVRSTGDLEQNQRAGRISAMLTVEDGALLEGEIRRLYELYEKGVRMLTLTWNYENSLAFPNSLDPEEHRKGLKPFGVEVVQEMNRLGMIVDVSHLSEGGFWDVARLSTVPFVASHSCARAVCDHQRNLTDEQLRALANCGGVVGVNYNAGFLRSGSNRSTLDDILQHVEHIRNIAGEDAVALGSDFDGITCELELDGCGEYGKLVQALDRRYPSALTEKICSENALRVFRSCLPSTVQEEVTGRSDG